MKPDLKTVSAAAVLLLTVPAAGSTAQAAHAQNTRETSVQADSQPQTDTLSGIASVSKIFAVTAVMQLAEAGKVDLDKPVTEYLPDFKLEDPRYKDITVRMLMNHSSGLMGSYYSDSMLFADRSSKPMDDLLKHLSTERLKAAPGAYGAYCNDGFDLLALITERVSGQSYTDYITEHICAPLGMQQTGTIWNAFQSDSQIRTFTDGIEFEPEYDCTLGGGGIFSTAPELAGFGSAFFTGNTALLSEKSKNEMKQCCYTGQYVDGFGLGWDTVADEDYTAAGVQVLSKGGDLVQQHAELYVAPDAGISIGVTCSGGSSSDAKRLAAALMDIALEEQGITVQHSSKPEPPQTVSRVPEEYLGYAGLYLGGQELCEITFPNAEYMEIQILSDERAPKRDYLFTDTGGFLLMEGDIASGKAVPALNQEFLTFQEQGGNVFVCTEQWDGDDSLGYEHYRSYIAQKAAPNPISDSVQQAWEARNGKKYYICGDCYSSVLYGSRPCTQIFVRDGYAINLKITDASHAEAALQIPSSTSRDMTDLEITEQNGTEYLHLIGNGSVFLAEDAIPELPPDLREVQLTTGAASWYNIGSEAYRTVTLDIPAHAAVYVYDQYDRLTYSSYMKHYGNTVSLPENGKIVFVGETGETIGIRQ